MDAARTEFHRRWAAKQFHEIYMNSIDAETHPERAARSEEHSALLWRNYGTFVRDTRDLGTYGFEGQYAGRNATQIERRHNSEYTNIKLPIVEFFRWVFTEGTIRLEGFSVQSNAEVRCSFRVAPWLQLFGENLRDHTTGAFASPSAALSRRPIGTVAHRLFKSTIADCTRWADDQARRRGRPPRRPFARELAAFRRLVWLPTSAAALTSATLGLLPVMDDLTVATFTFADENVPG